ncbi:hypothetical protein LSUE1_G009065 [Lachnellula suecica]|uniref:Uncharacterized protein n=1 Tax=Lachnellula suecica TaxID=602035 RepID=A0A8T9C727_9HELO|nr:hypothetical protein LSUE1_G009065 [Lachnellula suecica]
MLFYCLHHNIRSLVAAFIFSSLAQAQDTSSCLYTEHNAANSTGSILIPGFEPLCPSPSTQNSTWTISTAINQNPDPASNSYSVEQTFWLDASPSIDTSPANLSYTGCAILLTGFSSPRISKGNDVPNGCGGVFSSDCYNAITETIDTFLFEHLPLTDISTICNSIIATPPTQCKDYAWKSVTATQAFGNPSFSQSSNASCPSNVFNGTIDLVTQTSPPTSPLTNFTTYDALVKQASPLVLAGFTKNITDQTPRWVTSALVCLTPNATAQGSRVPESSGTKGRVALGTLVLALGVSLALGVGVL